MKKIQKKQEVRESQERIALAEYNKHAAAHRSMKIKADATLKASENLRVITEQDQKTFIENALLVNTPFSAPVPPLHNFKTSTQILAREAATAAREAEKEVELFAEARVRENNDTASTTSTSTTSTTKPKSSPAALAREMQDQLALQRVQAKDQLFESVKASDDKVATDYEKAKKRPTIKRSWKSQLIK